MKWKGNSFIFNTGCLETQSIESDLLVCMLKFMVFFLNGLAHLFSHTLSADNLICNVVKSLQQEIDIARSCKWDAVLVKQYLCQLREAKKQGRKEKRHKEAQAILAAATAAAAASSRISSFRKDALDEAIHQEVHSSSASN